MTNKPTDAQLKAIVELTKRRRMALKMFRSQPQQDKFLKTKARTFLIRGGNRSGKSTIAGTAFASIACDIPLTLSDGTKVDMRRPHQKGKPLIMWVIGYEGKHIGQTIYRILFKSGLFQIIRDEETKEWRSYRRWDEFDQKRASECAPSPPLIPPSYIQPKSWSWENKAAKVFERVVIHNPQTKEVLAEIYAFSSKAEVKAGDPVDVIWIDEKIEYPTHYPEWAMRLVDRNGWVFWSSWPAVDNEALRNITLQAEECAEKGSDRVQECILESSANKQLDQESLSEILEGLTPEERMARDKGQYVTDLLRMYPLFDKSIHSAIFDDGREDDLSLYFRLRREYRYHPGDDWTKELVLDPGTSNPGILLCAIPPPRLGDYLVVYDELYPGRFDADQLAERLKNFVTGEKMYRFLIDPKAGAQTPMGFSISIMKNYERAFKERGIFCAQTGSSFTLGSNNVGARIAMLQSAMHLNKLGMPKLRIVTENCPNLIKQLANYNKAAMTKENSEYRPASGQKIDLAVCLEYWVSSFPTYVLQNHDNIIERNQAMELFRHLNKDRKEPVKESQPLEASLSPIVIGSW